MENIIRHIEYLTSHNECVTLPGIGSFLSHYRHAVIDTEKGIITPPRRIITFNSSVNYDDGLLASSVARRDRCSYTEAARRVQDVSNLIQYNIQNGIPCRIGYIGTLSPQADGGIIFTPGGDTPYLPVVKLPQHEVIAAPVAKETVQVTKPARIIHTIARYAASIALLIGIAIAFTTPIRVDDEAMLASILPVNHQEISEDVNEVIPELLIAAPVITQPEVEKVVNTGNCYLIIASLATEAQAEQFMAEHKDDSLGVIITNGRYRVYAARGASYAEINNQEIKSRFPDAWYCTL